MDVAMMQKHIQINAALRGAFEKFRHHQSFTGRARGFIKDALPEYTVHVDAGNDGFGSLNEIGVWGPGLPYAQRFHIMFSTPQGSETGVAPRTWQEAFARELDRSDLSDHLERTADEERLLPELSTIEAKIRALTVEAHKLVANLPVPTAAVTRKEPLFWQTPSHELKKRFPFAFGDEE